MEEAKPIFGAGLEAGVEVVLFASKDFWFLEDVFTATESVEDGSSLRKTSEETSDATGAFIASLEKFACSSAFVSPTVLVTVLVTVFVTMFVWFPACLKFVLGSAVLMSLEISDFAVGSDSMDLVAGADMMSLLNGVGSLVPAAGAD